jgi:hypothetical protein
LPAGYGLLEGGRNSLLESAQEATLMSVPTPALAGQSNTSVKMPQIPHCKGNSLVIHKESNGAI